MARLTLAYEYGRRFFSNDRIKDDFGLLKISAEAERFSGRGAFWVQWQDVREFADKLESYPIASPISEEWGYDQLEGNDLILRIEIRAADRKGNLVVEFEIGDDPVLNDDAGLFRGRVTSAFITTYQQLEEFRLEIIQMMDRKREIACLNGKPD